MKSDLHQLRIVRRPEGEELTGLSRASLYRLVGQGLAQGGRLVSFPAMNQNNRLRTAAALSGLWDGEPLKRGRAEMGGPR